MKKLTPGFSHNIERLRVDPATFFHTLIQKVDGNNRNFVSECCTTFEWVLCSVDVIVSHQETTLATITFWNMTSVELNWYISRKWADDYNK